MKVFRLPLSRMTGILDYGKAWIEGFRVVVLQRTTEHRSPPSMSAQSKLARVVNIEDRRHIAKRRVPRVVFNYLDGDAEGEITLRENCRTFQSVIFRPRQCATFSDYDLRTRAGT